MYQNQRKAILRRLEAGDTLTPMDALNDPEIRTMKLSSRVSELIRDGVEIEKLDVETDTGKKIKAYRLARRFDGHQQVMF